MIISNTNKEIKKGFATKGVFPYKWAFTLLFPMRNIFLSAKQLIERIDIKENYNVLEVGPGPGYFSIPVARKLKTGKLYLADIQLEMLDYAKRRIEKRKIANVEYHLCNGKTFDFEDNFFDVIFLVTVLGEVENKEAYIQEFSRVLKNHGTISISELAGDPDKMSMSELKELFERYNFSTSAQYGNKRNFTINFRKKKASKILD
jgi:ubiquinone/menaquinone biosynthesis C-methylase UbiE